MLSTPCHLHPVLFFLPLLLALGPKLPISRYPRPALRPQSWEGERKVEGAQPAPAAYINSSLKSTAWTSSWQNEISPYPWDLLKLEGCPQFAPRLWLGAKPKEFEGKALKA